MKVFFFIYIKYKADKLFRYIFHIFVPNNCPYYSISVSLYNQVTHVAVVKVTTKSLSHVRLLESKMQKSRKAL